MLRIALCDDEMDFLSSFAPMIGRAFAGAGEQVQISTFSDGRSLIEKVEKEKQIFDIIFLDVEMPLVHGFQVAQRLRELNTAFILVFTTHMENLSREGYRYGAFRYVFKNNLEVEINETVASIVKKLDSQELTQETVAFKYRNSGVLEDLTLRKADIVYLEIVKTRRVILKTVHAEYELLVRPLSEYAQQLTPPAFIPIMRNYLLNLNHVVSIQNGFFLLSGGLTVPLGIKREVKKASMEKYLKFLEERI